MTRAAIAAVLLASATARAGAHHGGSGSHGGGSSVHVRDHRHPDHDSSSSGSSAGGVVEGIVDAVLDTTVERDEAASGAPPCQESNDIVGFRECTPFGSWARRRTPVFLDLGMHGREYGVISPARGRATALASALRIGLDIGSHGYLAFEGELGGAATSGELAMLSTGGTFVGGYGVIGARAGGSTATLSAELAAGVRDISDGRNDRMAVSTASGVLEARVRGEVWLTPWISAGATVGSSLVDRGDWMAGFYIGVHARAFGG